MHTQSQQNNIRATFRERCSNVILLTLNKYLPTEKAQVDSNLFKIIGAEWLSYACDYFTTSDIILTLYVAYCSHAQ